MNHVSCPQCGLPAAITDRFAFGSTSGSMEHVKIRCSDGHWFTLPEEALELTQPEPFEAAA